MSFSSEAFRKFVLCCERWPHSVAVCTRENVSLCVLCVCSYARSYLDADSIEELFNRVLGRVENAYPNFPVAKAFSYMTVSREGLNEDELLTLLGVRRAGDYTSFKHAVAR